MPCRHCKYKTMSGLQIQKLRNKGKIRRKVYRGDQNWNAHVTRKGTEQIGHLLQVVCRSFLRSHGEGGHR